MNEEELERLLYVVPSIVLILALIATPSKSSMASIAFVGTLASAVLYFLGFPGPASASLVSTFLSVAIMFMLLYPLKTDVKVRTITYVRTEISVVTVTNKIVSTEFLTRTVTKNVTVSNVVTHTLTVVRNVTVYKTFCGKVVTLTSYTALGPFNCSKVLSCNGARDVVIYIGKDLRVAATPIGGSPPTLIYVPEGTWREGYCGQLITVSRGETLILARPFYGQSPETVTLSEAR